MISFLWQRCPLVFTAASIVGATHEYTPQDLSHPVQKQIATLISTLNDFTTIRVVEQHQLNLMSGMLMKAGGLGEAGGVGVHVPVPPWKQVQTFSTYSKPY